MLHAVYGILHAVDDNKCCMIYDLKCVLFGGFAPNRLVCCIDIV